jgi:hypothetical protein
MHTYIRTYIHTFIHTYIHTQVEEQELYSNGTYLRPDSTTLQHFDISVYSMIWLLPKTQAPTDQDKDECRVCIHVYMPIMYTCICVEYVYMYMCRVCMHAYVYSSPNKPRQGRMSSMYTRIYADYVYMHMCIVAPTDQDKDECRVCIHVYVCLCTCVRLHASIVHVVL